MSSEEDNEPSADQDDESQQARPPPPPPLPQPGVQVRSSAEPGSEDHRSSWGHEPSAGMWLEFFQREDSPAAPETLERLCQRLLQLFYGPSRLG